MTYDLYEPSFDPGVVTLEIHFPDHTDGQRRFTKFRLVACEGAFTFLAIDEHILLGGDASGRDSLKGVGRTKVVSLAAYTTTFIREAIATIIFDRLKQFLTYD